jgi:hypothetical protein
MPAGLVMLYPSVPSELLAFLQRFSLVLLSAFMIPDAVSQLLFPSLQFLLNVGPIST